MLIQVVVDEKTEARLKKSADELSRTVEDLAESGVSEAALNAWRGREDDPADKI